MPTFEVNGHKFSTGSEGAQSWNDLFSGQEFNDAAAGLGSFWNSASGKSEEMAFNSAEAAKQRQFEEYMSSTAYQRGLADMQAAGINPAAINGGHEAASTPQGYAAQASGGGNGGFLGLIGAIAGTALKAALFKSMASGGSAREAGDIVKKVSASSSSAMKALRTYSSNVRLDAKSHSGKRYLRSLGYWPSDLYQDFAR